MEEIKKMVGESSHEDDENLQNLINKLSYIIHETQHKEWSIQNLLLFNSVPLMQ